MLLIGAFILIPVIQAQQIYYKYTKEYDLIWSDEDAITGFHDVSIWRPRRNDGWYRLGDVAIDSYNTPNINAILVTGSLTALRRPTHFTKIWSDKWSGASKDVTIYKMHAEPGYTCLGNAAVQSYKYTPDTNGYSCVKNDYIVNGKLHEVYNNIGSIATSDVSIWTVEKSGLNRGLFGGNFIAVASHDKPRVSGSLLAYDDHNNVVRSPQQWQISPFPGT